MGAIIFFLLFFVLILGSIVIRNRIIMHFNATQRAWADVISYERQKIHTLEQLQNIVEQYSQFEQSTLTQVIALRQNIANLNVNDSQQIQQIEAMSRELMKSLNVVIENYPELKSNELYMQMMKNIDEQNNNVSAGITIFNRNVEWFNNYIQIFPNNWINTLFTGKKALRPFQDYQAQQNFNFKPKFH